MRLERQLMGQTQCKLLFRWFIGLAINDAVWVRTVFTKNRERLIAHDAVIGSFNHVLEVADKQDWLSGEHFSVDGTLIQAFATRALYATTSLMIGRSWCVGLSVSTSCLC